MSSPSPWRHLFAGTILAITIFAGVWGGHWVDGRYATDPWGAIVGSLVGIGAGFYNFLKEFMDEPNR